MADLEILFSALIIFWTELSCWHKAYPKRRLCCSYFEVFASAILRSSSLQQFYCRLRFSNSTVVFASAILRSSSLQQFYGRLRISNSTVIFASAILRSSSLQQFYGPLRFSNSTVIFASAILRSSSPQQLYGRLRLSNSTVVFASAILRSSSLTDWSLRNIHFSNGEGSFSFYKIVSFCLRRTMNCLTLASAWVHHACLMGSVLLIWFSFLSCALFVFALCLVCPMLPVSLDCTFLIAPFGCLYRLFI